MDRAAWGAWGHFVGRSATPVSSQLSKPAQSFRATVVDAWHGRNCANFRHLAIQSRVEEVEEDDEEARAYGIDFLVAAGRVGVTYTH